MGQNILKAILLFILSQVGCAPPNSQNGGDTVEYSGPFETASAEDLDQLQSQYLKYEIPEDNSDTLPPELKPVVVLSRLHSWFRVGRGLKRQRQLSAFSVYEIRKIPDFVFNDLEKTALDFSVRRTSFYILTKQFWREIKQLQNQGFSFGLMASFGQRPAAGVYFPAHRMIVFHVLSEPGLLVHEHKHALQYDHTDRFKDVDPDVLTPDCLAAVSKALAEVDATQTEFPNYTGLASEIENPPKWPDPIPAGFKDEIRYPQLELFHIGMSYPQQAIDWVKSSDGCPQELMAALRTMGKKAFAENRQLSDPMLYLRMLRERHLEMSQSHDQELNSVVAEAAVTLNSFDKELAASNQRRRAFNAEELGALDVSIKRDLCRHALGAAFLISCEGIEGQDDAN